MCSRYSLTSPPEAVRSYFRLRDIESFPPRHNIAPTEPVAIVRASLDQHQSTPELRLVRWGLIPSWVKDPRTFATLINARAETAPDKPSFRGGLRHRRCLIPADGFYEWTGKRGAKVPHLIRLRSGAPMALAGISEHWLGADGSELETMVILTVPAAASIAHLHDRMPALLPPEAFEAWLDCRSGTSEFAASLLQTAPSELLESFAVPPLQRNVASTVRAHVSPCRAARRAGRV